MLPASSNSNSNKREPLPRWADAIFKAGAFVIVMLVILLVVALLAKGLIGVLGL